MKMKKIVSLAAAIAMSASLVAAPVSASVEDVEKIGLTVKTEGDKQVFVKNGEVWLFSHPWNGGQFIEPYTLYTAKLSSANGYEMRVTDMNKNQISSGNIRGDHLLKAYKGDETLYVPIIDQVDNATATGINQNIFGGFKPDRTYLTENDKGVFDRGFDESALVFRIPAGASETEKSRTEYNFGDNLTETGAPITTEFSVYVDGDATAAIYKDGGNELLKISGDGTASYCQNNKFVDISTSLREGKWHRIAISVDKVKGDFSTLWVYGVELRQLGIWNSLPTQLRFGASSASSEGNIAFADPRVYYGYYNSEYDQVNITGTSADVTISGSKIVYNDADITTADELKAEILKITDARDVKIYTDSGKTAFGLGSSSVVTLVPRSGGLSFDYTVESTATPFQKIGLVVSDKYPKNFEHAGSVEYKNNYYVRALTEEIDGEITDKLVVFNNANQIEYSSFGWRVLKTLSSTKGYDLSIWDSTKTIERSLPNEIIEVDGKEVVQGANAKQLVVAGDWLKAEKDGEVIWIPIIDKLEKMNIDDIHSAYTGLGWHNWNPAKANAHSESGIAGKAADDAAYAFTATDKISGDARLQIEGEEIKKYLSGSIYTYTMNVYADGDATAQIVAVIGPHMNAFLWKPDGTYYYGAVGKGADGKDTLVNAQGEGTVSRGKWHKFAMTLDLDRTRMQFFIDGKLISINSYYTSSIDRIDLRIAEGSENGTVAYDDFRVYEGYYDQSEDLADFKTPTVSISDDVIRIVEGTDIDTAKQTIAAELPGASLSEYEGGYLLVTPSGSYHYLATKEYAVNDFGFAKENIICTEKDGKLTASTVFEVEDLDTMLYLAEYDSEGRLVNVTSDDAGAEGIPSVTVAVTEGNSYKAFLWLTNEDYKIVPISLAK